SVKSTPRRLRLRLNLYPPYLAAGIRVPYIAPDWREARVELRARWWNRNYVGTHFGGSLFAMTDPFYMLLYIQLLGRDYIVWDYAAAIRFARPGRGTVSARFVLDDDDLRRVRAGTKAGEKLLLDHAVDVTDADGEIVARVKRTLYFRRKR
ncbi:MAG: DUF4442 domain-containing protein, partial [Wenzhouxiangellaceae bacterium]